MVSEQKLASMQIARHLIIEYGYKPIILKTAKDEIYLEKLNAAKFQLIRITPEPKIFNGQIEQDEARVKAVSSKIKMKSLTFRVRALNIYTANVGELKKSEQKSVRSCTINSSIIDSEFQKEFPGIDMSLNSSRDSAVEIEKIIKEIAVHTKAQAKKSEKFLNTQVSTSASMVLWILMFIFVSYLLFFTNINHSTEQIELAHGALNKSMVFGLNQFWRLLTAPFATMSIFSVFIGYYLIGKFGKTAERLYGTPKFIAITISAAITSGLIAMSFDGQVMISGVGAIAASWLAAILVFANNNKVLGARFTRGMFWATLMLLWLMISEGSAYVVYTLSGFVTGLFMAQAIEWKGKAPQIERAWNIIVVIGMVVAPLAIMNEKGIQYTEYENLDWEIFDGYSDLGINPITVGESICEYYDVKEGYCKWK